MGSTVFSTLSFIVVKYLENAIDHTKKYDSYVGTMSSIHTFQAWKK